MNCMFCKIDPATRNCTIHLVPSESMDEWACLPCAKLNGLHCETHDLMRIRFKSTDLNGFETYCSVCASCVDDFVTNSTDNLFDYEVRIRNALRDDELRKFDEWAKMVSEAAGDCGCVPIFRIVVIYALCHNLTPADVIANIESTNAIMHIFPDQFLSGVI